MEENQNEINAVNEVNVNSDKKLKSRFFMSGMVVGLAAALCISAGMYLYAKGNYKQASAENKEEDSVISAGVLNKLHVLEESVDEYYLEKADPDAVAESLYAGLINGLGDKYSTYYTAKELEKVRAQSEGVFFGIGAQITIDADTTYAKIASVIEGTPAEEAGLKDGDLIVAVDDVSTAGMDLTDVVSNIKGEENTDVVLTIYRDGEYEYQDYTITRKSIESNTVAYEMDQESGIATIRISEFDEVTTTQFSDALEQAKEENMKGLILDLRDNPGGNLAAVVDIAQEILPKGLIVYTEDKYGEREEYSCDGENELKVPMVVLVNENSASAAEILAGAIKDYGMGKLLGTTTFGKGIVQKIFGLTDGSAVKLTVSHYYTPNGNDIHGVGIEPDETLELDYEKYVNERIDNQMERAKAILAGEIK